MAPIGNAVYATLLMNDAYLPGAMVLGHSLKDRAAKAKLVALIVVEKLAPNAIAELQTVYDEVIPVQHILNKAPANLYLMNRPDLIGTFTKIQLWKQTQYKRIVYIDADVVALRAPNELLTMDTEFAAVPDIGWPDCFNSGVMVLNPNLADYYALLALAERGISFDGGDQGLLNMHFTEWERLSFKYNCTPSGNYQYVPAYRHFQSSINLVHFIGRDKPWNLGRDNKHSQGVYGELLARWWSVYDKHYRPKETVYYEGQWQQAPKKLQDYVSGEETMYLPAYQAPPPVPHSTPASQTPNRGPSSPTGAPSGAEQPLGDQPSAVEQITSRGYEPTPTIEQRRWSAPHAEWEPAKAPPPTNSKPEASNFPSQIYDFSHDTKLFQPPAAYPEAPKDMWYEVPERPAPPPKPKPIFPWEERAPKATRVFPQPNIPSPPVEPAAPPPRPAPITGGSVTTKAPDSVPEPRPDLTWHNVTPPDAETTNPTSTSPTTTTTPITTTADQTNVQQKSIEIVPEPYVSPWETFNQRTNAWDEMPDIARYVQALQPPKRGKIQVLHHTPSTSIGGPGDVSSPLEQTERRGSFKVTDFPSEVERPSLPVTPAPIRRPTFWGEEKDMSGELPNAEGVPMQEEWVRRFSSYPTPIFASVQPFVHQSNGILSLQCQHCGKQNPIAKLDELQRRQSEALLVMENMNLIKEPPKRTLPDSANKEAVEAAVEKATSPTSTRPLKPILKEPKFELPKAVTNESTTTAANDVHGMVTEEVLSPGDAGAEEAGASSSTTPTPTPKVSA